MTVQTFLDGRVQLYCGDCRDVLKTLADSSIDSVVTDPPYALASELEVRIEESFRK